MKEQRELELNVGDLVIDERQRELGLGVIIELEPEIQTADILDDTGVRGLRFGLAGTTEPVGVVGSIPISEIAKGLFSSSEFYQILGYDFLFDALSVAAGKGPKRVLLNG